MSDLETTLRSRSGDLCELCGGEQLLEAFAVEPRPDGVLVCEICRQQMADMSDDKHWHCLQGAIWSEVPAVKALSWRLLHGLRTFAWAGELLEQAYLDDDTLAWAREGTDAANADDDRPTAVDSNGTVLADGDSVTLIKDLDVKGAGFTAKRGTLVKGIRLTHDPEHIEGRVNKVAIVLKTQFLKKA